MPLSLPENQAAYLTTFGEVLRTNAEGIYGSRPWKTYGEGPTATATGHLAEHKNKPFTARDIRFTTQGESLYAIMLGWPESGRVTIKALGTDAKTRLEGIKSIQMLGVTASLDWKQDATGLSVQLPQKPPCEYAYVLKIR